MQVKEEQNQSSEGRSGESQSTPRSPCPFGCKTGLRYLYRLPDSRSRQVYCSNCNASGPWGETEEEAIARWNTRAEDAAALRQRIVELERKLTALSDACRFALTTPGMIKGRDALMAALASAEVDGEK